MSIIRFNAFSFSYYSFILFHHKVEMKRTLSLRKNIEGKLHWKNSKIITKDNIPAIAKDYLPKILDSQVYDCAIETPLTPAANLSSFLQNNVYLKREDMQPVFSFKIRGAYNRIAKLSQELKDQGIVTCSAGNHAQGVAMSASKLGINAIIVMPLATPAIKVNAVRRFGGPTVTIKLHGKNYDEAAAEASRLVQEQGLTLVHPFNDADVIAGQGTIAMEILKKLSGQKIDVIFACVGGGGLLSGIAAYVKALRPSIKVIGVEAVDAAGMTTSLQAKKVVTLSHVGLFADGAAVKTVGNETFHICQQLVDEMITVETDEICAAIKLGFNDTRNVLEPAGALAIAGMVKYAQMNQIKDQTFVAISSGANMDFDRLRFVSERADSSETLISVTIPELPGSFNRLYSLIYPRNVTEFSYRHNGSNEANVFVSFQSLITPQNKTFEEDKTSLYNNLISSGFKIDDLSQNEMAKAHARHLAGGRSHHTEHQDHTSLQEVVYRFEFPESPGALDNFLKTMTKFNQGWSISLFHYRNHGHDYGRVLVGLLVKPTEEDMNAFNIFLEQLGYSYYNESLNSAYLQFLK